MTTEGYLLIDKPAGMTSFSVVAALRRCLKVQKIGHGGTLDPFATGLLVMLVGRPYTRLADTFLGDDKEYMATLRLGAETDSYDIDGTITATSDKIPTLAEIEKALTCFQGTIEQVPPMFSAKKVDGKRLYKLARAGIEIERKACTVTLETRLTRYEYPEIDLHVRCSKGTYIRSIGHELGRMLGCFAYVSALRRVRSGRFHIKNSVALQTLQDPTCDIHQFLRRDIHADL